MWILDAKTLWLLLAGLLTIAYLYIRNLRSYWARKGVPYKKPHYLLGNFANVVLKRQPLCEVITEIYTELKGHRFGGMWEFFDPTLFITDPELIRDVMVKDFNSWQDRGTSTNSEADPLSQHIAFLDGWRWKAVRAKLTPVFTSAKLKHMHYLLVECGKTFEEHLGQLATSGKFFEARDLTSRFTTDVIGSCAFGIQMNSLNDEDALFRRMGKKLFEPSNRKTLIRILQNNFPWLFKLLNVSTTDKEIETFFLKITQETFDYREKNNILRHDFIDLLRNLRNTNVQLDEGKLEFTDMLLTAQAFVFFGAGFETSSSTISFCLHELAVNQGVQDRLREEVRQLIAENNGEITWDCLQNMKYLDMVFQETLRKYPIAAAVRRVSTKPYRIPGTKVDIPAGMKCYLPVYPLHYDPEYYPEPEKFIPERFTAEAKSQRPPHTYLPFGGGPRVCIGARFAEQETKLGIVKAIENFKLSLCEKSQNPLKFKIDSQLLAPERGIWLKISAL